MGVSKTNGLRGALLAAAAMGAVSIGGIARADPAPATDPSTGPEVVVTLARTTRSSVAIGGAETQ